MASTGEPWRLGHRPALDGLRGIAILLVLLSHVDRGQYTGAGTIGVTMFFTLSGFLITSLLLGEHAATGAISLRRFYMRRARRLLPALGAVVSVVLIIGLFVATYVTPGMLVSVLFYGSNWFEIRHGFEINFLSHTWTLAIEEQFYLLWPLLVVLVARRGARAVAWLAGLGAAASAVDRLALWLAGAPLDRMWLGSDSRADALLLGCLLAAVMFQQRESASRPKTALVALVVLVPAMVAFGWVHVVLVPYLTEAATAVVLWSAAQGAGVRWLEVGWLRLVGQRSYGLYLWQFPVISLLWGRLDPLPWFAQALIMAGAAWLAAVLSWRLVERRFLSSAPVAVRLPVSREAGQPLHPTSRAHSLAG